MNTTKTTDDRTTLDTEFTLTGDNVDIEAVADRVTTYLNSLEFTYHVNVARFVYAVFNGDPVNNNTGIDELDDITITGNPQHNGKPRAGTVTIHYDGDKYEFEDEQETYILGYDDGDVWDR